MCPLKPCMEYDERQIALKALELSIITEMKR